MTNKPTKGQLAYLAKIKVYLLVVYNKHVKGCVSICVFLVDVGFLGAQQSDAFLLTETSGKAQRVFAPVRVPTHRHHYWVHEHFGPSSSNLQLGQTLSKIVVQKITVV